MTIIAVDTTCGALADAFNLKISNMAVCLRAWLICFVLYLGALFTIDHDTHVLRTQMAERAKSM